MTKIQQKQFLRFFIAKAFLEKERLITSFEYVPEFKALISRDLVRIKSNWLENRNSNITTQLACIFKTFEDFRLVQQIREEIEKVKPSLSLSV